MPKTNPFLQFPQISRIGNLPSLLLFNLIYKFSSSSMFNQNQRSQYDIIRQHSLQQLAIVLNQAYAITQNKQIEVLIFFLRNVSKMLYVNANKTNIIINSHDSDLAHMIFEKCIKIKNRNDEILGKALNLRCTLTRQIKNQNKNQKNEDYASSLRRIKEMNQSIREKIQQYRNRPYRPYKLMRREELSKCPLYQLKQGTILLQKQILDVRKEFDIWKERLQGRD